MNHIGLPIGGTIFGISGVETGFLIGDIGVALAQPVERSGGGVKGDGLDKELHSVPWILLQQRGKIVGCVIANGLGTGYHQLGLIKHLAPGVVNQKAVGEQAMIRPPTPKTASRMRLNLARSFIQAVSRCYSLPTESTTERRHGFTRLRNKPAINPKQAADPHPIHRSYAR